jgi:dolichol-phosphate mannosyltransferase
VNDDHLLWGAIGVLLLMRLTSAMLIELSPQEAYYWNYAMHPALSYFDHPPMVAWMIRAGTFFLGKSEIGVRIGGLILSAFSTWLLYALGNMWFGRKSGLWAAVLFQVLPLYFIYGVISTPDVPLIFFWLLTIYLISVALRKGWNWAWYLAGVSLGFGALSKYTAIFLVPSALLFFLTSRKYRRRLLTKEPYVALLISLVLFSPVLIWNYHNQWASFAFQFTKRLQQEAAHPLTYFLEFIATQAGVVFPVMFPGFLVVLLVSCRRIMKDAGERWSIAFSFSFPLLAFFTAYSTRSSVKVNWMLPAYLTLLPASYPVYRYGRWRVGQTWKKIGQRMLADSFYALPFLYGLALYHMIAPIPYLPANKWVTGWSELGGVVENEKKILEMHTKKGTFIIGLDRQYVTSELGFYTGDTANVFSRNVLGRDSLAYDFWGRERDLIGLNALAVDTDPPALEVLEKHFARVEPEVTRIAVIRQGRIVRYFYLVRCYDYVG